MMPSCVLTVTLAWFLSFQTEMFWVICSSILIFNFHSVWAELATLFDAGMKLRDFRLIVQDYSRPLWSGCLRLCYTSPLNANKFSPCRVLYVILPRFHACSFIWSMWVAVNEKIKLRFRARDSCKPGCVWIFQLCHYISLSWNPKFQHIVASTSSNGMTGKLNFGWFCKSLAISYHHLDFWSFCLTNFVSLQLFGIRNQKPLTR